MTLPTMDELVETFRRQFPLKATGGLINPRLVCMLDDHTMELRCHYDGYDDNIDEDGNGWTWYYNLRTGEFYN